MTNLVHFALFQLGWLVAVVGAARGHLWWGPAAMGVVCGVHLALCREGRGPELVYLLAVGALGAALDSGLAALGLTSYPGTRAAWSSALVPPWIVALWVGFATLPRFSLAWLRGRAPLAALLGALGGPLSYLAGVRLGAVAPGDPPVATWAALALEYALVTPLLLRLAPGTRSGSAA